MPELFQSPNDESRTLTAQLMAQATHAALAFTVAPSRPSVTRIGITLTPDGTPLALVSRLAAHTAAVEGAPDCALLIGDVGEKGDPLTHPRLTLQCTAEMIEKTHADYQGLRDHFLAQRPKSKLYIDFPDFQLIRFHPTEAHLNAGFGKAFKLTPKDLG
ncbi:HugZ family protein [Yoonia sp. I 8.24]|uniref:HugZ family pyridoxamine 5'-phosphate oxidase n=1 Tax=Yoonia sp. I 8.24 TaxID=1537229 RepID=UPI001EDE0450|nr:pyridoxamine 5-phosphate oxidase [Yoonia sp. I 8.24]MCG3266300.1 pyridoxamine 5-phosphate oxidase [Yoonia sp. I 8.24]